MKRAKGLSLILAGILLAGGCTSNDTASKPAENEKDPNKKYTVTAIDFRFGDPPPKDGAGLKMINEKFNVDYQVQFVPQADYQEKLSAVVASGDVPDMVGFEAVDTRFAKWAGQGAFLPLDEYIGKYETLKNVPDHIWESMKVNGKIYGIPTYYPEADLTPIIRKDWLDKLGLEMPKNYEELKAVALAFTKNDPDGNGKNDTYGFAMGEKINPDFDMGAYWNAESWLHKDKDGKYIPGMISDARKEMIQFFADLYKEKAITQDYAVLTWPDTNKEFFSGKAGIFVGAPRGMSEPYYAGLLELQPNAEFAPLYPFADPDGNTGYTATSGYGGITAISADLAKDPGKIKKILEMMEFGRTFYPREQRTPENKEFDWWWGNEGKGYTMQDGTAVLDPNFATEGKTPSTYYVDNAMWPPNEDVNEFYKDYKNEKVSKLAKELEEMHKSTKHYMNPVNGLVSETAQQKKEEFDQFLFDEQAKMIAGQRPVSEWDKMVEEFLNMGGQKMIEEYNSQIKDGEHWK
ncbi:extracellular solute-binding protein [Bacillus sp. SJS]|uniref:extracellular solute-binding protein n=1 Tax=Bacillus sp. SJS TaxID=1423321 RepID=UPI0004DD01FE|nr:extracellular solute-binding protein [Bacillus sp. SJS]KZZ86055.1 ABC transporter substrate-binding protein [Bacillus sp. SJS]